MGLFGFGKKKSPAEILAEGRKQYDSGDYSRAALTLLKAFGKENGEIDYWIGRCFLANYEKKAAKGDKKQAKQYLTFAAEEGHAEAARLLAKEFGVQDYLPQEPAPKPELQPAPKASSMEESAAPRTAPSGVSPSREQKPVNECSDHKEGVPMTKVPFADVLPLMYTASDSCEQFVWEKAWEALEADGLTGFSNPLDHGRVYVYAYTLNRLNNEFYERAFECPCSSYLYGWEDKDPLSAAVLAQLCQEDCPQALENSDPEQRLEILAAHYKGDVTAALLRQESAAYWGNLLYAAMNGRPYPGEMEGWEDMKPFRSRQELEDYCRSLTLENLSQWLGHSDRIYGMNTKGPTLQWLSQLEKL